MPLSPQGRLAIEPTTLESMGALLQTTEDDDTTQETRDRSMMTWKKR